MAKKISNALILRDAIKTFKQGQPFTKESVRDIALSNNFAGYFHTYFNDLVKKGVADVKVINNGDGTYHWELIEGKVIKPDVELDYSQMIETENNKGRFENVVRALKLDVDEKYVVLLTKKNSERVERALKKDLCYEQYAEKYFNNEKIGTVAVKRYDRKTIIGLVRIIDFENGTQQWLNTKGRTRVEKMVEFIVDKNKKFWDDLKKGKPDLVDRLIAAAVDGEEKSNYSPNAEGPRSLASKICKYLSLYAYSKDNYYINDRFVRNVIPHYYRYYLEQIIDEKDVEKASYCQLHKWLSDLHKCDQIKDEGLSKNEFDHLMWYSYKNSRGTFIDEGSKGFPYFDL